MVVWIVHHGNKAQLQLIMGSFWAMVLFLHMYEVIVIDLRKFTLKPISKAVRNAKRKKGKSILMIMLHIF